MPKTEQHLTPVPLEDLSGAPALDPTNPLLAKSVTISAVPASRTTRTQEPMLRRLRNIYGDSVLEILPLGIREAVDQVYVFSKANEDVWQTTPFDSEDDKDDCLTSMRAYAEMAGTKGYTIYTKATEEAEILVWKVGDRRQGKGAKSE